jgi:hypothetical protein
LQVLERNPDGTPSESVIEELSVRSPPGVFLFHRSKVYNTRVFSKCKDDICLERAAIALDVESDQENLPENLAIAMCKAAQGCLIGVFGPAEAFPSEQLRALYDGHVSTGAVRDRVRIALLRASDAVIIFAPRSLAAESQNVDSVQPASEENG